MGFGNGLFGLGVFGAKLPTDKPKIGDTIDPNHPLSQNLLALYPFVDGSGNTLTDFSGNGNHGTLLTMGGAPWLSENGGALDFNGGGYVDLGAISSTVGAGDFTLIIEIYMGENPSHASRHILTSSDGDTLKGISFNTINTTPFDDIYYLKKGGSGFRHESAVNTIIPQTWQRIIITRNNTLTTRDISIYVDGILNKTYSPSDLPSIDLSIAGNFLLGTLIWDIANKLIGRMSDVRIYDRGFSSADAALDFSDPWSPFADINLARWFRSFQHLLPKARAWDLTIPSKTIHKFFNSLSSFPSSIQVFFDDIFDDIDPEKTRELAAWEKQFGLLPSDQPIATRRTRLLAAWRRFDGQDITAIQDTLQAAGFNLFVHEWWQPGAPPAIPRDPTLVLNPSGVIYMGECGELGAECGEPAIECGNSAVGLGGYVLVNNSHGIIYKVPSDTTKHPYFIYIGGATFPDLALESIGRKKELETLLLKITPAQQWIGVLISFS